MLAFSCFHYPSMQKKTGRQTWHRVVDDFYQNVRDTSRLLLAGFCFCLLCYTLGVWRSAQHTMYMVLLILAAAIILLVAWGVRLKSILAFAKLVYAVVLCGMRCLHVLITTFFSCMDCLLSCQSEFSQESWDSCCS